MISRLIGKKQRHKYFITVAFSVIGYNVLLASGLMSNNNSSFNSIPDTNENNLVASIDSKDTNLNSKASGISSRATPNNRIKPLQLVQVSQTNSVPSANQINQNQISQNIDPNDTGLTLMKNYAIFSKLSTNQSQSSDINFGNNNNNKSDKKDDKVTPANMADIATANATNIPTPQLKSVSYTPNSISSISNGSITSSATSYYDSNDGIATKGAIENMSDPDLKIYQKVQNNLSNIILNNFINKKRADEAVTAYVQKNLAPLMLPSSIPGAESEEEYYNRIQKEQRALSEYISKKYRIALKAAQYIVEQAYEVGNTYKLDPKLVLALVATESQFNPLAASSAGALGLTQSMQKWHPEKFERIKDSGKSEFSIEGNLDIGAQVLREYMKNYNGNTVLALQQYNGSLSDPNKTYSHKVLGIETELNRVAERSK